MPCCQAPDLHNVHACSCGKLNKTNHQSFFLIKETQNPKSIRKIAFDQIDFFGETSADPIHAYDQTWNR